MFQIKCQLSGPLIQQYNIVFAIEIWLPDSRLDCEIGNDGFNLFQLIPLFFIRGGGACVYIEASLISCSISFDSVQSGNLLWIALPYKKHRKIPADVMCRPPSSSSVFHFNADLTLLG